MARKTTEALELILKIVEAAKVSRKNPNVAFVDLRDLEACASAAREALEKESE